MKEMEVGVKDVNLMSVGAWTTGSAVKKNIMLDHLINKSTFLDIENQK